MTRAFDMTAFDISTFDMRTFDIHTLDMPTVDKDERILAPMRTTIMRTAGRRSLRLLAIAAFGLALAACSKCDMPTWRHDAPAPQSCHDGPDVK
jgi:hypothetical protein